MSRGPVYLFDDKSKIPDCPTAVFSDLCTTTDCPANWFDTLFKVTDWPVTLFNNDDELQVTDCAVTAPVVVSLSFVCVGNLNLSRKSCGMNRIQIELSRLLWFPGNSFIASVIFLQMLRDVVSTLEPSQPISSINST